jgi:Rieske Fe-S protein
MELKNGATLTDRRGFLKKAAAAVIGGLVGLVPTLAGLMVLLDPLRHKSAAGSFIQVTTLDSLPDDGVPRAFKVITDKVDAWNKYSHVGVGAVYLRRTGGDKIEALNVVCPHAGGFVDYVPDKNCFICPLHNSKFALNGSIGDPKSPASRGMDTLEVSIRNQTEVWVKFQNFQAGHAAKIPVA